MKRAVINLAYRIRRRLLAIVRWPTRGVKVMVYDPAGRLLLIRNLYGRTDLWVLPGGGIHRRETPEDAAIREVREETGCALTGLGKVATFQSVAEGKRDTVHLFRAETSDQPTPDLTEVAEARFFALDALPESVSSATRRRIDETAGVRPFASAW